jgi:hypothetical protein
MAELFTQRRAHRSISKVHFGFGGDGESRRGVLGGRSGEIVGVEVH